MRMLAALVLASGCASAGAKAGGDDEPLVDAPDVLPDAPPGPVTVTLSQNTSENIAPGNTLSCTVSQNNVPIRTDENSYYRVFPLSAFNITSEFAVESVAFGVESAQNPSGTQTVTVRIGTYGGAFDAATQSLTLAQLAQLATADVAVANSAVATITVPITATIPPNSNLYVELFSANVTNNFLFPGSNNGGETHPAFLRAPGCGANNPTSYPAINMGVVNLVLTVTGTHTP